MNQLSVLGRARQWLGKGTIKRHESLGWCLWHGICFQIGNVVLWDLRSPVIWFNQKVGVWQTKSSDLDVMIVVTEMNLPIPFALGVRR